MNTLILGKSDINAEVEKALAREGHFTKTIQDAGEIIKFNGVPGDYELTAAAGKYGFSSVIVTEPPEYGALAVGGGATVSLIDAEALELLLNLKTNEKFIILLDYEEEAPEYITAKAVNLAKRLADKKKDVVFLAKTIKSGYGGNELTNRETRGAGVTFIKYESAELCYDEEADRFKAEVYDGVFTLNYETPYVITAAIKESAALSLIAKKLRLYDKPKGSMNNDKFFLCDVFTARRGIYYINPSLGLPDKEAGVKRALAPILSDMASIEAAGYVRETVRGVKYPEVNADKCAFCYSCYRACPHGALEPDAEASAMKVIEALCEACGTCIAICPGEAIARKDFERQPAGKGKCKIYCCENGAEAAFYDALPLLGDYGAAICCEPVSCGGNVGIDKITRDFSDYDSIIIACCPEGACRHMEGDKRACRQVGRASELLGKAGLDKKSVEVINISHSMKNVMRDKILSVMEGLV